LFIVILLALVLIIIEVDGHLSAGSQEFGVVLIFVLHSSNRRLGWQGRDGLLHHWVAKSIALHLDKIVVEDVLGDT
tara:strand:+ start:643 stop:870 length:228 start_codon:yes stop_codon:yes gene_type:complete